MRFALNYDYPPTADLSDLFGSFDRLLSSSLGATSKPRPGRLAADFFEDESHFHLRFELPGAKREDVSLEVENRVLTVAEGDAKRGFQLPENADSGAVEASFADGVLTVSVGRAEEAKPRSIEIN